MLEVLLAVIDLNLEYPYNFAEAFWIYFIFFSSNTCQTGLYALHWSCILLINGWKHNESVLREHLPKIVEIQSVLYSNVEAGNNVKRSSKAFNLVRKILFDYGHQTLELFHFSDLLCVWKNSRKWETLSWNHDKVGAKSINCCICISYF